MRAPLLGMIACVAVSCLNVTAQCAEGLEYYRSLAANPRSQYKQLLETLPFEDRGKVTFAGAEGAKRLRLGEHTQTETVDGLTLSRVVTYTRAEANGTMQLHNGNPFPVFVEVAYESTAFGDGAYVALAPGETVTLWSWAPVLCDRLRDPCDGYDLYPASVRVRTLTDRSESLSSP
jgi:hypothetical protein